MDGARSHGLNELNGHFVHIYGHSADLSQGWSIRDGNGNCELFQRVGKGVHWIVWDLSMTNSIFKG